MEQYREDKPTNIQIKEWSEGNEHLEKLLLACKLNNILSMFCCAGHDKNKPAYIMLKMNKETIGKIYSIINSLKNTNNISIDFSRIPIFSDVRFVVHMYDENEKNSIMDSMAKATYREERLENLPENFRKLVEVAELLVDNNFNFDLSYYTGKEKSIYFRNFILKDTKYPFNSKIKEMGFTLIENGANNHYFIDGITEDKEHNVWKKIIDGMKNICAEVNKDKEDTSVEYEQRKRFEEMLSNNGEYKKVSAVIRTSRNNKNAEETIDKII